MLFSEFVQSAAKHAQSAKFVRSSEQFPVFAEQPFRSIRVLFQHFEQRLELQPTECAWCSLQPTECAWCSRQPVRQPIRPTVRVIQRPIGIWNA